MWKSLITISIVFGILAGWLRYETTTDLKNERAALIDSNNNLDLAKQYQTDVQNKNKEHVEITTTTSDAADTQETEEASKVKEKGEKVSNKAGLEAAKADVEAKLTKLERELAEIGEIEDLVEKSQNLQAEMASAQQEIAITKENYKNMIAKRENTDKQITALRDKVSRQRAGQMIEVNAKIAQTFDNWGFVVIDKGGNQGINARVKLDVKRGDKLIGKINITNLEPNVCVCDVLSLSEGEKLAVGDSVILSAESKWDPSKKPVVETISTPAAPTAAPEKPAAPAEKADDDPFGLGGDDTPAPEKPAETEDPFGL
ncbi:MAG TPA: hypothetical protein EYG40_10170 [Verrucomicrobia bacterium]|nr:hypothetical protein [Verrucomicrobiales bacterium]HIL55385.1 hypothetical protein [Verrucomicrobiota bacterium]